MTTLCAVDDCERPVPDTSFVCPRCGDRLTQLLNLVPGILDDLDDVIRRQVRFTTNAGPRSTERTLPFNPAAAESRTVLDSTLTFWWASISEVRGLPMLFGLTNIAAALAQQVGWLRAQATGADAFDELTTAIRQARRVTDRPADKRFIGPCTAQVPVYSPVDGIEVGHQLCGADLYARDHGNTTTCPSCGAEYNVPERRAWLLEQAADRLLPWREIGRAVDGLGVPINNHTLKSWVQRKRLIAHGEHPKLYRVGDVVELARAAAEKRGDVA